MGEDSIRFLCLNLRITLLLKDTRGRITVTKKFPNKWQYKLHCTSQDTVPHPFSPHKFFVLTTVMNKLPKKPE